jgi:hypothetical protein
MRRLLLLVIAALVLTPNQAIAGQGGNQPPVPPIHVPGARSVYTASPDGVIKHLTSIPSSSAFARHGGRRTPCTFTATYNGRTHTGVRFVTGQQVFSDQWIFDEVPMAVGNTDGFHNNVSSGPLSAAKRQFFVYCDTTAHPVGFVIVAPTDSLFDPHLQLTTLYNTLQLQRPTVYRNPVVDIWGGLVTRYPAWLAIDPAAWTPGQSNVERWRGWNLSLTATPAALAFQVRFTPDPAQSSPAFNGIVACVAPGTVPAADAHSLPAMPTLPAQTTPGVNGPCMWTPPGPGTVIVEARITYRITLWANGFTEQQPDYVWTSTPSTFSVGELNAVNVND